MLTCCYLVAEEYGFKGLELEHFRHLFKKLVYSYSENDYLATLAYTLKQLDGDESHPYYQYLLLNWDNCKVMWASYLRGDVPHLGNNTTNRIESGWFGLKVMGLTDRMELDETLEILLACEALKVQDFDMKSQDVSQHTVVGYDEHMLLLLDLVSGHAADLIFPQYLWATAVSD